MVAVHGVTLGAELPGTIREIDFDSGMWVKQGAVLVRLDTSTEEAQLVAARAEATLARLNLERARSLRQGDVNTPADLEAAEARAAQAGAAVAGLEAAIAKKTIRAPFDGRIAIRQVELGQVVTPGTPVASLQSVDPPSSTSGCRSRRWPPLRVGQQVRLRTDTYPGATWDGRLATINPEVDPATRNVRLRATFGNADGRLRPGMYASVEVLSAERQPVLLVPATAAIYAPYGDSVFVLEPTGGGRQAARHGGPPALRAAGRATRRPGGGGLRPEGRRDGGEQRRLQAAQRGRGGGARRPGARRRARSAGRSTAEPRRGPTCASPISSSSGRSSRWW